MKFLITMNMPSINGKAIHQVILQPFYKFDNLEGFAELLLSRDFVMGEEFYYNKDTKEYESRKNIILNTQYIGKVKLLS